MLRVVKLFFNTVTFLTSDMVNNLFKFARVENIRDPLQLCSQFAKKLVLHDDQVYKLYLIFIRKGRNLVRGCTVPRQQ